MDDFITLSCPTCGGKLTINKDAKAFVCEYCGRQHIIRPEDKEFYAKCPLCQRNDKVDKVTALYSLNGFSNKHLAPPSLSENELIYNPDLKPKLRPRPEIKNQPVKKISKGFHWFYLVLLIPLFLALIGYLFIDEIDANVFGAGIPFTLLFFFLLYKQRGIIKKQKENWESEVNEYKESQKKLVAWKNDNKRIEVAQVEWESYKKKYDQEYHKKKAELNKKYDNVMERYRKLYYCRRDDCIFIPGEIGYASASELNSFVHKGIIDE